MFPSPPQKMYINHMLCKPVKLMNNEMVCGVASAQYPPVIQAEEELSAFLSAGINRCTGTERVTWLAAEVSCQQQQANTECSWSSLKGKVQLITPSLFIWQTNRGNNSLFSSTAVLPSAKCLMNKHLHNRG